MGELVGQVRIDQLFDFGFILVTEFKSIMTEQLDAVVMIGVVRGGNHDTDICAQRARQHGYCWGWHRAKLENIHAGGREARNKRVFDHIAGKAGILTHNDAVAVCAAFERYTHSHANFHGGFRCHW